MGIRNTDGLEPLRRASCPAAGIMIASAPTFLISPDATPTEVVSSISCELTRFSRCETSARARSITPERCTDADSTSADPTMMTISSENPENASAGLTIPSARPAIKAMTAVTS